MQKSALTPLLLALCILAVFENSQGATRHRISGVLLFAHYDGIRVNLDIPSVVDLINNKGFGEVLRMADGVLQRSEIKGTVTIQLLDANKDIVTNRTIFHRDDYDDIAFAQPFLFSEEFDVDDDFDFKIACDLVENDHVTICEGSHYYPAKGYERSTTSNEDSGSFMQVDTLVFTNMIASFLNQLGYEKLYRSNSDSNIKDVIKTVTAMKETIDSSEWAINKLFEIENALRKIGGVFTIGLNVEPVTNDVLADGTYKKVEDTWSLQDNPLGMEDPYGQIYVLPQAKILPLRELLRDLGNIEDLLPERALDMALPIIKGPAFPLFDMSRAQREASDYQIDDDIQNTFSIHYKNSEPHSYAVFSNMWEADGVTQSTFEVDDCFSKGNAFGFDMVNLTYDEQWLSMCDYGDEDLSVSLRRKSRVLENYEYELRGTFKFEYTSDDPGSSYEPYGYFDVIIDGNITDRVWNEGADDIDIPLHHSYTKSFGYTYPSMKDTVTLKGYVKESDVTDDDVVGYIDKTVSGSELTSEQTYTFYGSDGYVTITLERPLPIKDDMAEYEMFGSFNFNGTDGNGVEFEPFGSFSVEIKNRAINAHFPIWSARADTLAVDNHEWYRQPFKIRFVEREGYLSPSFKRSIILHGKVMEYDPTSGNEILGILDGTDIGDSITVNHTTDYPFDGEDGMVLISAGLRYVGKIDKAVDWNQHTEL